MFEDILKNHKNKLRELAEKNTVRDKDGMPVLSEDDVWLMSDEEYEEAMIIAKYGDIILNAEKEDFITMPENMTAQEYREWRKSIKENEL